MSQFSPELKRAIENEKRRKPLYFENIKLHIAINLAISFSPIIVMPLLGISFSNSTIFQIWPKFFQLVTYCSNSKCAYSSNYVGSVFVTILSLNIIVHTGNFLWALFCHKRFSKLTRFQVFLLQIALLIVMYIGVTSYSFSFDHLRNYSVMPNYISDYNLAILELPVGMVSLYMFAWGIWITSVSNK